MRWCGLLERIEIIGTLGTASLIGGGLRVSRIAGDEEVQQAVGSTGSGASIMDFPNDAHRAALADSSPGWPRGVTLW